MNNLFAPAVRKKAKLRLAILGPTGAGKTYTALALASALGPRVAVMDTENGSASLYGEGHPFTFDDFIPPDYEPETYVRAVENAAANGYDVIVLDSLTHAWYSLLDGVDDTAKRKEIEGKKGDSFAAWRDHTPRQRAMVEAIVRAPIHVIATIRTEMETVREGNTIRRIGLQPVQRKGLEYEFTVILDIDQQHTALVSKSRMSAIEGKIIPKPGEELGKTLLDWLNTGVEPPKPRGYVPPVTTTKGWEIVHETMGAFDGAVTLQELGELWKAHAARMNNGGGQEVARAEREALRQYSKRAAASLDDGPQWTPTEDECALVEAIRSHRSRAVLEQPMPDAQIEP
jgi:hypothetical protein